MLTILPYLLLGYGRSKCTLLHCPDFGEMFKYLKYKKSIDILKEAEKFPEIEAVTNTNGISLSLR
jgi:hypothetical protein